MSCSTGTVLLIPSFMYILYCRSGIIWQVKKGKKENWKTLSTSINAELEEAYQSGKREINQKHLVVSVMQAPHLMCLQE